MPPSHPEMAKKWGINASGTKSVQMTFTTHRQICSPVTLNGQNPSSRRYQIFRAFRSRSQTKLEETYIYQAKTTWTANKENVLTTRLQITTVD